MAGQYAGLGKEASEYYAKAIKLGLSDPRMESTAWYNIGAINDGLGDKKFAMCAYAAAVMVGDFVNEGALWNLALTCLEVGDRAGAADALQGFLRVGTDPAQRAQAKRMLARIRG